MSDKKLLILFLICSSIFVTACKKPGFETDSTTVPGAPTGVTATAENAQATVTFTTPVSNGGSPITGYTVTSSPGGLTKSGPASPITVTGLTNGTAYTFTVTAINIKGTSLPSSASNPVTPSTVPEAPTGVAATAGNAQATVTFTAPGSNGGSPITGYTVTSSPGGFTKSGPASPLTVTGLTNGTAYTFTVTATNANGTGPASYVSNSVTPVPPSTVPGAPTGVTATAGNAQATVTFTAPGSNGGSPITGYTVTSSPGGFTKSGPASPVTVTGLTNGTAYTFTVTATNANGTGPASYASNYITPSAPVTDGEGNLYSTVIIGTQVWLKENLRTTKYNDGTSIPNVINNATWAGLSTSAYCWYNNDDVTYRNSYGALYNWFAVNTGKLCPVGWHVPTDLEWKTLEMFLGMTQADADAIGRRGEDVGTKLKSISGWNSGGNGTNASGFTALPAGDRSEMGIFGYFGIDGTWWSSSLFDSNNAWFRSLNYSYNNVERAHFYNPDGFSVRCVKD